MKRLLAVTLGQLAGNKGSRLAAMRDLHKGAIAQKFDILHEIMQTTSQTDMKSIAMLQ